MIDRARKIVAWFQRNERHLSTPIFIAGFVNDLFTVGLIPFGYAVYLFGGYLLVAGVTTIAAHYLYVHQEGESLFVKSFRVVILLVAQFATGGLLSGCLIFYSKGAALAASWPFVLLLGAIFIGNEFFRLYRERLAFRSVLFFFTTYAYVIFALPTYLHTIGPETFLESTAVSLGIFFIFVIALGFAGRKRLIASLGEIVIGVVAIAALVNASYFTGIIPPLPLSIQDVGVYHTVVHENGSYVLRGEGNTRAWWDIENLESAVVHHVPGTPVSVYSAVFAPISFSTGVMHVWQKYDAKAHRWTTLASIAFPITGGRDGGYRGYSTLSDITQGKYRVSIETLSGLVIGRTYFTVEDVEAEPQLTTETK